MGMHARVMRVELGDVDRAISFVRDQIVPSARQQQGIVPRIGSWIVPAATVSL